MKINSYIRPYRVEHCLETDATTVIKCHSGSDDCLVQHVLMAAKRKGKSVEWVVYIIFNGWFFLPSNLCFHHKCNLSLVSKTKCSL